MNTTAVSIWNDITEHSCCIKIQLYTELKNSFGIVRFIDEQTGLLLVPPPPPPPHFILELQGFGLLTCQFWICVKCENFTRGYLTMVLISQIDAQVKNNFCFWTSYGFCLNRDNIHESDFFSLKIPIFLHACEPCSVLPSNLSTMILQDWSIKNNTE